MIGDMEIGESDVLLVVDIQERLVAAMPAEVGERVVKNACILIEAARRFALPIVSIEMLISYRRRLEKLVFRQAEAESEDARSANLEKVAPGPAVTQCLGRSQDA